MYRPHSRSTFKDRNPLTQAFHQYSQTRKSTPEQQWYLQNNATKIQLAGTTLCMDGGAKGKLGEGEIAAKVPFGI